VGNRALDARSKLRRKQRRVVFQPPGSAERFRFMGAAVPPHPALSRQGRGVVYGSKRVWKPRVEAGAGREGKEAT